MTICQQLADRYPELRDLFEAREQLGIERYSIPLDPLNDPRSGRWHLEAIEEGSDGAVYTEAAIAVNLDKTGPEALENQHYLNLARKHFALAMGALRRIK